MTVHFNYQVLAVIKAQSENWIILQLTTKPIFQKIQMDMPWWMTHSYSRQLGKHDISPLV